jgi:hypothetical protein
VKRQNRSKAKWMREQFEITRVLSGQSADVMDQFLRDAESAISDIDPPPAEMGPSRWQNIDRYSLVLVRNSAFLVVSVPA